MKIRRLTKETITHMNPVSGSSSQPSWTAPVPSPNQVKLAARWAAGLASAVASAPQDSRVDPAMAAMAAPEASARPRRGVRAPTRAASNGSAGMSQMNWTGSVMVQPFNRTASCSRMFFWWR